MIGSSKNNRENYPRKCFWTKEKEALVGLRTTGPWRFSRMDEFVTLHGVSSDNFNFPFGIKSTKKNAVIFSELLWLIGNRTSCHLIRSVIILVIKQIAHQLDTTKSYYHNRSLYEKNTLKSITVPNSAR